MAKTKKPAKNAATKKTAARAKPKGPVQTKANASEDDRWWKLIEQSRKGAEDGDEQADALIEILADQLSPEEIVAFDTFLSERIRDAFRSDLWAVAYIMNGGCSDDGFDYFIGWLIMKGKKHYEAALAKPEDAAKGVSPDDEPFENEACITRRRGRGPRRAASRRTISTQSPGASSGPSKVRASMRTPSTSCIRSLRRNSAAADVRRRLRRMATVQQPIDIKRHLLRLDLAVL